MAESEVNMADSSLVSTRDVLPRFNGHDHGRSPDVLLPILRRHAWWYALWFRSELRFRRIRWVWRDGRVVYESIWVYVWDILVASSRWSSRIQRGRKQKDERDKISRD
jgi:hypothetical protein